MTTTLSEGVKVPDVGSVNWAGDLEVNWNLLNGALANLSGNVKLDRDNTWTGEQSFTLPIVGSIIGTASKAIADEDGTSIKTGYGKLANVNIWSTAQVFLNALRFNNTSYVSGTPSANIFYATLQWGGYVNNTWTAPFTINNAIRTNGYSDTSFRTYSQTTNTLTGFVLETNADASDISLRPIVNGTHKLGSSSYQWSSVYAQSYYYNGTAWGLDKLNKWTDYQYFSKNLILTRSISKGTVPASSVNAGFKLENDDATYQFAGVTGEVNVNGTTYINISATNRFSNGALDPSGSDMSRGLQIGIRSDGTGFIYTDCRWRNSLEPHSADSGLLNLGTSTHKWKTINGLNPGALSLPDIEASINIAGAITDFTGATQVSLSSSSIGWVYIQIPNVQGDYIEVQVGNTASIRYFVSAGYSDSLDFIEVLVPKPPVVTKVRVKATGGAVSKALFYPCLGNV